MRAQALLAVLLLAAAPAHADPLLELRMSSGAVITLRSDRGPCVGRAALATYEEPGADTVPGCYVIGSAPGGQPVVEIAWLDGDRGRIALASFRRVAEL